MSGCCFKVPPVMRPLCLHGGIELSPNPSATVGVKSAELTDQLNHVGKVAHVMFGRELAHGVIDGPEECATSQYALCCVARLNLQLGLLASAPDVDESLLTNQIDLAFEFLGRVPSGCHRGMVSKEALLHILGA